MEQRRPVLIRWRLRAVERSDHFPVGAREEEAEAWYEPHELDLMRALVRRMEQAPPGSPEREEALASIATIHELKATMDARIVPE